MQYKILLSYNENTKKAGIEEQTRFIRSILEALGVQLDFWNSDEPFSVSIKIKLRELLSKLDISIIDDNDGGLKIFHDKKLIAEWFLPQFVLKKDESQIELKKKLYLEMTVSFKSIFDNDN